MAISDIIQDARSQIYGQGLGEKPSLIRVASAANISTSGDVTTLDLDTGAGTKVREGDVLSMLNATDATDAFVFYVLGVSGDTVTVTFLFGSPIPTGTDLDDQVLELDPLVSELIIARNIEVITSNFLYPHVFDINVGNTVTPDLTTGQVAAPAGTREVLSAHQIVSSHVVPIGFFLKRNLPSALSASGALLELDAMDGSTVYLSTIEEVTSSTSDASIQHMIATGAAALSLDGTVAETQLETANKTARDRQMEGPAQFLWRSFLQQRQALSEDLSRDTLRLVIER